MEVVVTKVMKVEADNDMLEPINEHWAFYLQKVGFEKLKEDIIIRIQESDDDFKFLLHAYHSCYHFHLNISQQVI
jgi:hypothetical protein